MIWLHVFPAATRAWPEARAVSLRLDVLLSHGYVLAEDEHERQVMMPYPPLGLLYVSAWLKSRGLRVEVHDSTFSTLAELELRIHEQQPLVLGLYGNLVTRANLLRLIAAGRAAGCFVVLGGPEPAPHAEEYLRRGAHVVVEGEGELTLEELVGHLRARGLEGIERVAGTITLGPDGRARRAAPRPQIALLDQLPWPDREAIAVPRYLQTWRQHHGFGSLSLITARGCPYTCTWCSHSVFGLTHRRRSVGGVADEVANLVERWAPDRLWYADDVFTIHAGWFLDYAAELGRRRLRVPFECISRADRLDERVADALAGMGCRRVWIGAESGSQRILDAMKRRTTAEDVRRKTALLQARGIQVGMFIMLGYEGEDESDLRATAEHLKAASPDVFLTTVSYPIEGTEYHDGLGGRVESDLPWEQRTDRQLRVAGRPSRRFYTHATRWLVNDVALHRLRREGGGGLPRLLRHWAAAQYGRLGMRLTRGEREAGGAPGGRGWDAEESAARRAAGAR